MPRGTSLLRRTLYTAPLLATALFLANCGDDDDDGGPSNQAISDLITAMSAAGGTITASAQTGNPPAEAGGPAVTVTGLTSAVNGGTVQVQLNSTGSFTTAIVFVDGVDGFYQVDLPGAVTSLDLLLTLAQSLTEDDDLALNFGVGADASAIGTYEASTLDIIEVGSGDVQVSVSWTGASDVDLHVVDPDGEEIFYGNTASASGGTLDLDSNAGCAIDNVNNENITWATAPSGTYIVRLDYWSSCGVTQSDYVVTIQRQGQQPQTFTGSFTGTGDQGGEGSGTEITQFTF